MARAYLEAVFSVLGCWRRGYCRSASVSVIVTLGDGAVIRLGDGALGVAIPGPVDRNLGCGDTLVAMVGRDVSSISCRVLMACICSSPNVNRDGGSGFFSASAKPSTYWRAASVEDSFGTRKVCGKNSTVFIILSERVAGT